MSPAQPTRSGTGPYEAGALRTSCRTVLGCWPAPNVPEMSSASSLPALAEGVQSPAAAPRGAALGSVCMHSGDVSGCSSPKHEHL